MSRVEVEVGVGVGIQISNGSRLKFQSSHSLIEILAPKGGPPVRTSGVLEMLDKQMERAERSLARLSRWERAPVSTIHVLRPLAINKTWKKSSVKLRCQATKCKLSSVALLSTKWNDMNKSLLSWTFASCLIHSFIYLLSRSIPSFHSMSIE